MKAIELNELRPLHDAIIVHEMSFDIQQTATGIIIGNDDGKSEGIKPRWAKVYAVGTKQTDVKVGEWVLVEHGRWTRGIKIKDKDGNEHIIRRVENSSIMLTNDTKPSDVYLGESNKPTSESYDFTKPMY